MASTPCAPSPATASCVDAVSGLRLTVEGRLTVTTPFAVCGLGGLIPLDAVRTYRFDHFSADVEDGDGVVEAFAAERLVETVLPLRTGCDQGDATLDLDGALSVQRRGGVDAALRATDLHLERRGSGSAGACSADHRGARRARDRRPLGRARGQRRPRRPDGGGRRGGRRCGGSTAASRSTARGRSPSPPTSRWSPAHGCPSAGVLELERARRIARLHRFAAGGLRVDADGDGTPERVAADCRDPALASACSAGPVPRATRERRRDARQFRAPRPRHRAVLRTAAATVPRLQQRRNLYAKSALTPPSCLRQLTPQQRMRGGAARGGGDGVRDPADVGRRDPRHGISAVAQPLRPAGQPSSAIAYVPMGIMQLALALVGRAPSKEQAAAMLMPVADRRRPHGARHHRGLSALRHGDDDGARRSLCRPPDERRQGVAPVVVDPAAGRRHLPAVVDPDRPRHVASSSFPASS